MGKVRVESFTISADGFGAGPDQTLAAPMGSRGHLLHGWAMPTRTFQRAIFGKDDGTTGEDDHFARRGFDNIGAWIMGRNMFAPSRGPWPDDGWQGWWGDEPPYHTDVFVLTHHGRPPLRMAGGTTFHFITEGIHAALEAARASAGDADIRIGGGAATIRQYLAAGLVDEMHIAISPVLLGNGEPLFAGLDLPALGYTVTQHAGTAAAQHLIVARRARA